MKHSFLQRVGSGIGKEITAFSSFVQAKRGGFHIDIDSDYKNSVLVAGSGRGGTTWLGQIINADNSFRDIFEPFNPAKMAVVKHFCARQYLRSENHDPRYLEPARLVFAGKVRADWTDRYNRRVICTKRLIKDIRVNLMLKWISSHFPDMPTIFLLRHPCAVALSRMFQRWKGQVGLRGLLSQDLLIEDYLKPMVPAIIRAKSDFEQHILVWCVENYVPLRSLHRNDVLIVFYENLCIQPKVEIRRLAEYLRLQSYDQMLQRVGIPSTQTRKKASAIALGQDLISSWKTQLSGQMMTQANDVLKLFGLSHLYGEDSRPLLDSDGVLSPQQNVERSKGYQ